MRRSLALAVLAPLLAVAACSAGPETTKGAPTGTGAGRPSSSTTTGPSVTTTSATTTAVTATAMPRATTARPSATSRSATRLRVTPKPAPSTVGLAGQVLGLVNAERAKAGCNAVRSNSALTRAAQGHSADMAAHDYFSHTSKDGRTFSQRIRAAGYSGGTIGENIAAGQSSASAVMRSWMGSSGHRANILNCRFTALGVGYARGGGYGYYWTQDFGG
jgi:uncharacterized protein YkwD